MPRPPCYDVVSKKDCELRHVGCSKTCERWVKYVEARNLDYDKREKMASAGIDLHAVYTHKRDAAIRESKIHPRRYK